MFATTATDELVEKVSNTVFDALLKDVHTALYCQLSVGGAATAIGGITRGQQTHISHQRIGPENLRLHHVHTVMDTGLSSPASLPHGTFLSGTPNRPLRQGWLAPPPFVEQMRNTDF